MEGGMREKIETGRTFSDRRDDDTRRKKDDIDMN